MSFIPYTSYRMITNADRAVLAIVNALAEFKKGIIQASEAHASFWSVSSRKRQMALLQLMIDAGFPLTVEMVYHGHWLAVGGVHNSKGSDLRKLAEDLSYGLAFRANLVEDQRGVDSWVGDHIANMLRNLVCRSFVSAVRLPSQTADKSIARRTADSVAVIAEELGALLGEDGVGASPDVVHEVMVRIRSADMSVRKAVFSAVREHCPKN